MSNTPTLAEVLLSAMDSRLGQDYRALPGRVESFDPSSQRISVQPLIRRGVIDESGDRQAERLPVITDVPVCYQGAGDISITFPLAPGDVVLLIFASASLDKWLAVGGDVDPLDDRRHALSDAIAIPGLRATPNAIPAANLDTVALKINAPAIHAGGTAALALASEINALRSAYTSHTHLDPVSGSTGVPSALQGTAYPGTAVLKGG